MTFQELQTMVAESAPVQEWKVTIPVDQVSDTSVASIVRRATSGQPILGDPNQVYDGAERTDKVNPLNNMGFDLDDLIDVAKDNNKTIEQLKDQYDMLKADSLATDTKPADVPLE